MEFAQQLPHGRSVSGIDTQSREYNIAARGTYDDLGEALNFVTNRRRHLTSFGVYSSSHRNRGNFDGELRYTLHTGRLLYSLATKSPALGRSHRRRVRFESSGHPRQPGCQERHRARLAQRRAYWRDEGA
jgi:hypothetical protein